MPYTIRIRRDSAANLANVVLATGEIAHDQTNNVLKVGNGTSTFTNLAAIGGGGSGNVATDTIWDVKGDLVVGTGANIAQRLGIGTSKQVLVVDTTQTLGVKWDDITNTFASQTANRVFAAPDGTNGVPTFRALVSGDIPSLTAIYQPVDATLTALAGLTITTDTLIYGTGTDTFGTGTITTFGRSLVDDADAEIARTTLGFKTAVGVATAPQAETTIKYVRAAQASLTKGMVVYVSGSNGNNLNVSKAQADAESTSSKTIGLLLQDFTNVGDLGYAVTEGLIEGLDTNGLTPGAAVWLSPTTAGGWTTTKPSSPNHLVFLGWIVKDNASTGSIYVKVTNGQELDELHDVQISSSANNDILQYDNTVSPPVWKNRTLSSAGIVPTTRTVSAGTGLSGGGALSSNVTLNIDFAADNTSSIGKAVESTDTRLSNSRTPLAHTHNAADINAGVLATARLASSGTANSGSFLRGDQTWSSTLSGPLTISAGSTTSTTSLSASGTFTSTSGTVIGLNYQATLSPTTNSSTDFRSLNMSNRGGTLTGITLNSVQGARIEGLRWGASQDGLVSTVRGIYSLGSLLDSTSIASGAQVTNSYGIQSVGASRPTGTGTGTIGTSAGGRFQAIESGAWTVTNAVGIQVVDPVSGQTITESIGIDVAAQTQGTTAYGVKVGATSATTAALYLAGTTATQSSGILFGTDTNLYCSASNTLKTDDSFVATGTITGSNLSGTNTGDQTITLTGNVTGSGTGSFATTIATGVITPSMFSTAGATSGDVIKYNGTAWALAQDATGSGSGSPGGNTTEVQYNNSGAFAGSSNFTWTNGSSLLTVNGNIQLSAQGDLRFADANSSNYVAFQAPATVSTDVTWTLPAADGSANQVLSTDGSGALSWVTAGGTKTYAVFTPIDNQPPAANYATLDTVNTTSPIAVLDFNDGTDEYAIFVGIMPEGSTFTSGLKIILFWTGDTTSTNSVVWSAEIENDEGYDIDTDGWDTNTVSTTTAHNGVAGQINKTIITLGSGDVDGIAAGQPYRLRVFRDANNGSDNYVGDAMLMAVEVRNGA